VPEPRVPVPPGGQVGDTVGRMGMRRTLEAFIPEKSSGFDKLGKMKFVGYIRPAIRRRSCELEACARLPSTRRPLCKSALAASASNGKGRKSGLTCGRTALASSPLPYASSHKGSNGEFRQGDCGDDLLLGQFFIGWVEATRGGQPRTYQGFPALSQPGVDRNESRSRRRASGVESAAGPSPITRRPWLGCRSSGTQFGYLPSIAMTFSRLPEVPRGR